MSSYASTITSSLLAIAVSSMLAGVAHAQDAAASSQADTAPSDSLGDIVVTAQRRSERLQDVPIAVAALTGDSLKDANVTQVEDLTTTVPSLKITNTNGFLSTSLRGLGSTAVAPGYENPLAIYVDGVYMASQQGTFLRLANIEQVEVLKGPQGTLFGRNATAGLLQVKTRDPGREFEFNAEATYSNYNTIEGTAYIGGPIGETLSADISFYGIRQGEGYGKNRTSGEDTYKIDHNILVRSKWVWAPGEGTRVTLIGDYSDQRDSNILTGGLPGSRKSLNGPVFDDIGYDSISSFTPLKKGWNAGGSLKIEQELGALELVSTTAYRKSRYFATWDRDFQAVRASELDFSLPERQFTQELQLQPTSSGPLKWVVGAFYFDYSGSYEDFHLSRPTANAVVTVNGQQDVRSLAGYAQATYEIAPQTNVTFGGRYTWENRDLTGDTTIGTITPGPATFIPSPKKEKSFEKFTFRVSLDHRFNEQVLAYASFNRGFKSGGFNTGSPGTNPYLPETIDAYEVGLKTNLIDRTLRFNVAGFYYDYANVQATRLAGTVIEVTNAASARIYGADFDFDARISDRFHFFGGFGWTNAKYKSYPRGLEGNVNGGPSFFPAELGGNRLALAAKYTVNLGINYTAPFAGGSLRLSPNIYFNSGYFTEADNNWGQDGYAQVGANARWTSASENLYIGVYGRNLTNKRILAYSSTTATNGLTSSLYSPPRTYGVTVGVKY